MLEKIMIMPKLIFFFQRFFFASPYQSSTDVWPFHLFTDVRVCWRYAHLGLSPDKQVSCLNHPEKWIFTAEINGNPLTTYEDWHIQSSLNGWKPHLTFRRKHISTGDRSRVCETAGDWSAKVYTHTRRHAHEDGLVGCRKEADLRQKPKCKVIVEGQSNWHFIIASSEEGGGGGGCMCVLAECSDGVCLFVTPLWVEPGWELTSWHWRSTVCVSPCVTLPEALPSYGRSAFSIVFGGDAWFPGTLGGKKSTPFNYVFIRPSWEQPLMFQQTGWLILSSGLISACELRFLPIYI